MFTIKKGSFTESHSDTLIVGIFDKPLKFEGVLNGLDKSFQNRLTDLVKEGDLSAKKSRVAVIPTLGYIPAKRIVFIGLGKEKDVDFHSIHEAVKKAAAQTKECSLESVSLALDSFITENVTASEAAEAIFEAFFLARFQFTGYRTPGNEPEKMLKSIDVWTEADEMEVKAACEVGKAMADGTNTARKLTATPSNMMTASDLADHAMNLANRYGFEIEVLERADMEKIGMGAFLAVAQGSVEPPKMITLKYNPKDVWDDVLTFVGKGVTFDTGGYSIKSKDGIVGMKTDMAGAAAVLGAMEIIGELQPDQPVMAVIAATDNVISGHAFKPDDVITSLSGKTIEVKNTDAEGRLVLADAITYAKQQRAGRIVDVATLTGGVIIALGKDKTGALTNNEPFFEQVLEASHEAGEFIWQLPLTEFDKERIRKSDVADLNNSPGREGHAIMGGGFIGEFAENTPWVHLDIAGSAEMSPGVMTRTLAILALS
ncbi:leucyl aminopeptidase [Domibacillus epiphyticus]|uniref:Probable cytosol aminopeptidase n=1 Tax=Domibacillus epiphyticus TaxID=1714355 RepID=A0A1V2A9X8_9BACI|nr:leucyl aminopeptidase [Domibacillus epiphyticus]OMP67796.1 leucyl aminopeptidase [Domibacillus epiphyticus]